MHSYIRPYQHVALRLPSELTKIVRIVPNTVVFLGKYGSFPSNQIIGRPFYLTFEITDASGEDNDNCLRIVPPAELHAETLIADGEGDGDEVDVNEDGTPMRTNREIVDDASTQKMTLEEIEALKKVSTGAGREIIAKLLESHSALDQKTAFSLAKYTLRKRKKFLKRFTVLPLDVSMLTNYFLEGKEAAKTMELRDESIGLIGCWGNVHHGGNTSLEGAIGSKPNGRYLVVDETGGLVVAAMAERMGILYPHDAEDEENEGSNNENGENAEQPVSNSMNHALARRRHMAAVGNTITVVHANKQPSLALLRYFGYDQDNPDESHPLYKHMKTVSWMQLLDPQADTIYANEPTLIPDETLSTFKTNKRSAYYKKRSRWERVRRVVNETRAGDFDGLIVATLMEPASVLKHTVPLLAGSAPVVVYSPTIEPLTELADLYSTPRRTAYITRKREIIAQHDRLLQELEEQKTEDGEEKAKLPEPDFTDLDKDFALDPSLLLAPTLETSRVRTWQVLPGRTHPLMSGRGGAEGYIFHAIRVLPSHQIIQAAGNPSRKKRKLAVTQESATPAESGSGMDVEMQS
ncbi:tRNA 1-methyladenosine methyltransferase subunit GCD10 [Aspergillus clavatus NRRL 1]|uniref:tRNA (adenine(58)-N(1))-methyltransferase non-catalytic subunit TRM6 n=1 Tax=Aspergillus clavatus (strain ATCC 1007 / CBS 513.65 / DSM 816 / NCTC 3887 / NRRL 1 / QM 1276 / 107) TaxID=344612 RepID=A1C5G7_ASPCL|nr:eukaryotic translation initiation factor 3, gamma subunit, putative [Aspergillus clavatus NRRL 1]EAW14935.1 eukaryotic translation initiation factor 3, gamma subunit, putative [Aspergillus clavatus NRRL 1]